MYKTKTLEYKVTASSDKVKTVSVQNLKNSKAKAITVPATIKIGKYTYKVTEIAPKAFRKKVKLASVTIGTNVRKIGKNAFEGCKKLKKVTIKSKVLKSVGKQALKGIYKKAKVSVPKKQYKAYVKLFKKAKTAKSVKIVKK
ncbi:MAG: leucine-rich repeat protein [Lachnospiraceae bacterium]|nr:leucine-rich repeat protein [Lachnospiraceae bacterium]MCI9661065.1 leucine-rich repeat protein [Lachnospiraceae bacterium]